MAGEGAPERPARSWRAALAIYGRPRVVGMAFLGFSAGLPFLLVFATLSAWLRDAGVAVGTIGFVSWIGITYSVKVFWAPVLDHLPLPGLTRLLGRRRAWMLVAQLGIVAGLAGMAVTDPLTDLPLLVAFCLLVAFASATQDVVIDAYRIEAVARELQGAMAASYIFGYRLALLAAGAGALYLAEGFSWRVAYLGMAALALVGPVTTLLVREPEVNRRAREAIGALPVVRAFLAARPHLTGARATLVGWLYGAVACPFLDFFARYGRFALVLLLAVAVYRLSDITMGVMANPFYIDLGFSKADIANVTKLFGFFMSLGGAFLGGLLVARYGLLRPLLLGAVLVAGTNLLFVVLADVGPDLRFLVVTISADNLSGGLAGAVFVAYLSSLTSSTYTATQYALFSSLMTLPGKFIGGFSGQIVEAFGYGNFFLYAAAVGVPSILLVAILLRRDLVRAPATA